MSDDEAKGWDAIDQATQAVHGGEPTAHLGLTPGAALGGGLDGVSAWRTSDRWHLVSYGLSELYDKVSDDPPRWAVNLLEQIARQTQLKSIMFGAGHRLQVGGPIDGASSPFTAVAFTLDPQLGAIDTPHGRLQFLQLVGITDAEVAAMKATSTATVLADLARHDPLLTTDPTRLTSD